jgi:hypothetical protein
MRSMGSIDSSMDVMEQTNALGSCDAFEKNPITASFLEDTIYHCITHGFTADSFYVCIIVEYSLVCEVCLDWFHPVLLISN